MPGIELPPSPAARCAAVIGGTRRVGLWASEALLDAGFFVHALYRQDASAARAAQAALDASGARFATQQADAEDTQALGAALDGIGTQRGGIDVLVCGSGPSAQGSISAASSAEYDRVWRGNVLAVHNAVRAALPHMRAGGRIVCFSSAGADAPRSFRDVPLYASCKAALVSYCRSLARELAPRGITVTVIALGITDLPPEGAPAVAAEKLPSGKPVGQADVAAALRFIVSPDAQQLTGSVLNVSGGFGL